MIKPKAHLLHIGKTGGTAVKSALREYRHSGKYEIVFHRHRTRLYHLPVGEKVFFFVRHPITRFVSGFNSRIRQGRPRFHYPWSQQEQDAFARFKTANELAEALSDVNDVRRRGALRAMRGIRHVRDSVWRWFRNRAYFASRASDVLFVGFQETLASDFERLTELLALGHIRLPTDPIKTHQTPSTFDQSISELGKQNLLIHYATDVEFYEEMKAWRLPFS